MLPVSSRTGTKGCVRLLRMIILCQQGLVAQLVLQVLCCTFAKNQDIIQGADGLVAMMADEVELEVLQPGRLCH